VWVAIGEGDLALLGMFIWAASLVPAFVLTEHLGRAGSR
jgi:hypothetical protein